MVIFSRLGWTFVLSAMVGFVYLPSRSAAAVELEASHASDSPRWTTSRLVGTPDPPLPMRSVRMAESLVLDQPITLTDLPDRKLVAVLQRGGKVVTFDPSTESPTPHVAMDLGAWIKQHDDETLAAARDMTLDPNFSENGHLYIAWGIRPFQVEGGMRISRFTMTGESKPSIDPRSRLDLLSYPSGDHVGASVNFGPDGYLYVTTGDGARPFPPDEYETAQNLADLRGAVLRIDVRGDTPQSRIPKDNPFVDVPGARGEIFAYGIRNGFRAAFDPATDDFWVADVGWERCEMIHRIEKGGNHGWSLYEGPYPVRPDQKLDKPGQVQGTASRIEPAIVMSRDQAQSVTGGCFVPRGLWDDAAIRDDGPRTGDYLFGCFMNGSVWTATLHRDRAPEVRRIASTGVRIIDFVHSPLMGGLIVIDFGGGLHRLEPNSNRLDPETTSNSDEGFPRLLSQTGLYTNLATMERADGVFGYDPASTLYRDGLVGDRAVGVPPGPMMDPTKNRYPTGTVFANTLSRDLINDRGLPEPTKLETQILQFDGLNWNPYTYAWNTDQSDAELVPAGGDRRDLRIADPVLGTTTLPHIFAARSECVTCHHVFNPGGISIRPENLWREETSQSIVTGSLRHWDSLVAAGAVPAAEMNLQEQLVDASDAQFNLDIRARSYLHQNCSHCHQPAGGAASGLKLLRKYALDDLAAVDVVASQGDFGLGKNAKLIQPGHPERSVLMYRTATAGPGQMPRLGCRQVNLEGAALIWDWIASLDSSPAKSATEASDDNSINAEEFDDGEVDDGEVDDRELNAALPPLAAELLRWREVMKLPVSDASVVVQRRLADNTIATDAVLDGLWQRWIDPQQRRAVVGDQPDVEAILAVAGNAESGRQWFHDAPAATCRGCHQHGGRGGQVGPALDEVAKQYDRRQLLHHIIAPSEKIDPRWATHTVLTLDGDLYAGLIESQNDEKVTLRQADGAKVTILAGDVDFIQTSDQSIMPAGTLALMTIDEVADLLAFLMVAPETAAVETVVTHDLATVQFGVHRDCPTLQNDHVRVVLHPDVGGRVLRYALIDAESKIGMNALFVSDYEKNDETRRAAMESKSQPLWRDTPSAGRFDIGPEMVTPRRPELFSGRWTTQRKGPLHLRLTSPESESVGVRLHRDFVLDDASSQLTVTQTIENVSDRDVTTCHWSRTLANGAGVCVIPRQGFGRFKHSYVQYKKGKLDLRPDDPAITVHDDHIVIQGIPEHPKLGFDSMAGWIAHRQSDTGSKSNEPKQWFIKRFQTYPDRPYLEAAAMTISTWTPPTGETTEIEPIGPGQTIAPGQTASFTEVWNLLPIKNAPSGPVNFEALRKKVEQLPRTPWQSEKPN